MDPPEGRQVDRQSPVPLYYQLQEILKQAIDSGRWSPGELLPSEGRMIEVFGVSRTVVRKALDVLEGDGQVYRVNGKGTIVATPKFRYDAVGVAAEWGGADSPPPTLSEIIVIQRVAAGGHIGRLLGLPASEDVFELVFTHSIQGSPYSLTQMYLRCDATSLLAKADLPRLSEGGPEALAQLRSKYDLTISESQISIEATPTNQFEADRLAIKRNAPVFLLSALDVADSERPVAFSRSVVRSDHFRFGVVVRYGSNLEGRTGAGPETTSLSGLDGIR